MASIGGLYPWGEPMDQSGLIDDGRLLWQVELAETDTDARRRARGVRRLLRRSTAWLAYLRAFGPDDGGEATVDVEGKRGRLKFGPFI